MFEFLSWKEAPEFEPSAKKTPEKRFEWPVLWRVSPERKERNNTITSLALEISEKEKKLSLLSGEEKKMLQIEISSLKRDRSKLVQLDYFQNKSPHLPNETRDLLKNLKNVDTISAHDLLGLKKGDRGMLAKFFAYKKGFDNAKNPEENPLDINTLKEWDEIVIDFGGNLSANDKIWAADILPVEVQCVKITDKEWNVRYGARSIVGGRAGYYDANGKYLPIFNGYTVSIPTKSDLLHPEFKQMKVGKVFEKDVKKVEALKKADNEALEYFRNVLQKSEREDKMTLLLRNLEKEIGSFSSYKDKLLKLIQKAEQHLHSEDITYDKAELTVTIERLKKTLEIIGDKDLPIDFERYKRAIAAHESGGMWYFARNDKEGKKRWVRPGAWAFWKYQFTVETLKTYGVNLSNPPSEEAIQNFLNKPALQEEVMDRYMLDQLTNHILSNNAIMTQVSSGEKSVAYFLALTHIGWAGALKKSGGTDWLGTSTGGYAQWVANAYERTA